MEDNGNGHYDVAIIGCGMAGLAAGIRLAHFGKQVIILERHNAPGGLNSFYSLEGRKFDVGLHAVTNFVRPGVKGTPLVKLLRQLRINRDEWDLCEQKGSRIAFPGVDLRFSNDFELFETEVARAFPHQIDGFRRLVAHIRGYNETSLEAGYVSARAVVREFITDTTLEDMIFCPVMYYGSAVEDDMDFSQFVIMFKALFFEGFARPYEGVRKIIRTLLVKYREAGGKRKMKCGVRKLHTKDGKVSEIELDDGTSITATQVLSSAGLVETLRLCDDVQEEAEKDKIGQLSFVESITVLDRQPVGLNCEETIVFFNGRDRFAYRKPEDRIDPQSGVICFPNNYDYGSDRSLEEGFLRITVMANYDRWMMPEEEYVKAKAEAYQQMLHSVVRFLPGTSAAQFEAHTKYLDIFTPRTVKKFTGHLRGAIYGSPTKIKDGRTHLDNLYLCGTDQGFLGIIGAMLSGISMANLHVLSAK